ncbi:MAG: YceI family protein [Streptosporangiaceae bacterium]
MATPGNVQLGPDAGRVVIKTARAGLAARAGHDLTLEVTRWSARVDMPAEDAGGLAAATVSADLDLGSLEVREGTGGALPLTDRDRREIKKQMSGILGSATATFASSRVIPSGSAGSAFSGSAFSGSAFSGGAVEGTVTLNGKTQPARLQLTASGDGQYRGSATLAQSGFGIKPYSGFFGALKLKDEVTLEFQVTLPSA